MSDHMPDMDLVSTFAERNISPPLWLRVDSWRHARRWAVVRGVGVMLQNKVLNLNFKLSRYDRKTSDSKMIICEWNSSPMILKAEIIIILGLDTALNEGEVNSMKLYLFSCIWSTGSSKFDWNAAARPRPSGIESPLSFHKRQLSDHHDWQPSYLYWKRIWPPIYISRSLVRPIILFSPIP